MDMLRKRMQLHVLTCRRLFPTYDLCKRIFNASLTAHRTSAWSVQRLLWYDNGCVRAQVQMRHTRSTFKVHSGWVPSHAQSFCTICPDVPEKKRKISAHVPTCRCTPPMTCVKSISYPRPNFSSTSARISSSRDEEKGYARAQVQVYPMFSQSL